MLSLTANTAEFLARLNAVPAAVQTAVAAAVAAAARASAPGEAKAAAIAGLSRRARARRLQPDRAKALARFAKPEAGGDPAAAVKQAAVQAALDALGRG
jgi:hypothetical protein